MLEFFFTDQNYHDTVKASENVTYDIDIGKNNDFELAVPLLEYDPEKFCAGGCFYTPNEEYGGFIDNPLVDTKQGTVTFSGYTFRGRLETQFIEPPNGQDYLTVSGELNALIRHLIGGKFGSLYEVETSTTGISATCKVGRYYSVHEAIVQVLATVGYKLEVKAIAGDDLKIHLAAKPVIDYSDEDEVSQDYGINFKIQKITRKYNYMLALGKGELSNRVVVKLHLKDNGDVEEVSSFPMDAYVYKYDFPSAEDREQLIQEAKKKFSEINKTDNQSLTVKDGIDIYLGDIVGGRDYVTGMTIAQKVTRKIIKKTDRKFTISYEIGG